jgi:hypothetical protein
VRRFRRLLPGPEEPLEYLAVARERQLWQRAGVKRFELEHLRPRLGPLAIREPRSIGDTDHARRRPLGDVINAQQACDLDARPDLLTALAPRCIRRILVVVDEAAGQAPQALARFDRAAAQQDPLADLDDHRGDHLGVVPQDEVVVRAGLERAALDDAGHERGSAIDAEVTHRPKQ